MTDIIVKKVRELLDRLPLLLVLDVQYMVSNECKVARMDISGSEHVQWTYRLRAVQIGLSTLVELDKNNSKQFRPSYNHIKYEL